MDNTNGDIIIYQTDDGLTKIDVKVENETVWFNNKWQNYLALQEQIS